jgi:hypothetical protein
LDHVSRLKPALDGARQFRDDAHLASVVYFEVVGDWGPPAQSDYLLIMQQLELASRWGDSWDDYIHTLRELYGTLSEKERKRKKKMINELKNANINRPDTEELVALLSFAWALSKTYAELKIETPDWLDSRTKEITREINMRELANKDKRIKEVEARLTSLESTEEKKTRLKRELEELKGSTSAAI